MESIKNRTTIRKYSNREVSDELLNRLIEEAERTPTMGCRHNRSLYPETGYQRRKNDRAFQI